MPSEESYVNANRVRRQHGLGFYVPGQHRSTSYKCANCKRNRCMECTGSALVQHHGRKPCMCRHADLERQQRAKQAVLNLDPNL